MLAWPGVTATLASLADDEVSRDAPVKVLYSAVFCGVKLAVLHTSQLPSGPSLNRCTEPADRPGTDPLTTRACGLPL